MKALVERRYSSYSFSTSALDGGELSASRLGLTLPPGKGTPVPIVQEAGFWLLIVLLNKTQINNISKMIVSYETTQIHL
jgi:hypothetical protein